MMLETKRLILRKWEPEDAKSLYRYAKDPLVGPAAGWKPHESIAESRTIIQNVFDDNEIFAVVLKETGEPIGSIGIMPTRCQPLNEGSMELEIGYWIGLTRETYTGTFWKAMGELSDEERTALHVEMKEIHKAGSGNFTCGPRLIKQKQEELYAVEYVPFGGVVSVAFWKKLVKAVENYENIVVRMDRNLHLYICNLLAEEVHQPLDITMDGALTRVEQSRVSDRCSICPAGTLDPQAFVGVLLKEIRKLRFYDGVLPTFTVSGCERCCFTVPREELIFVTQTDTPEGRKPGRYCLVRLHMDGDREIGYMPQQNMAEYLVSLAALVQSKETDFTTWYGENRELFEKLTLLYCQDKTEEEA